MTHKTKGIVLKTVKYGETSIITTLYTELFGVQSYIVKGVRQSTKKVAARANYFQPAGILDMVVYHNALKNLNFIKEYQWAHLHQHIFFDVVKNTVALYIIETLQNSLKQPEANPELFYLVEDSLRQLDKGSVTLTANLPLYFVLHLAATLGFQLQGQYSITSPFLDLQEGIFSGSKPSHAYYIEGNMAQAASELLQLNFYNDLDNLHFARNTRQQLLKAFQNYLVLHIPGFGEIKSLPVLEEIFS